jgi:hypothetical protein
VIRNALNFNEPSWTTDGEILNLDRSIFLSTSQTDLARKFTIERAQPGVIEGMSQFLDQTVCPIGYVYKDVVQPFLLTRWLSRHRFPTIRIKRPLADVAYSMMSRGWYYPASVFPEMQDRELALLKGLVLANQSLDLLPGKHIDFDKLIYDEEIVRKALASFYPHLKPRAIRYIDPSFERMRDDILARRKSRHYKSIFKMLAKVT